MHYTILRIYGLLPSNRQVSLYRASRLCTPHRAGHYIQNYRLRLLELVSIITYICWSNMSPYVRSRTFCCCLPVRFGVFVSHHRHCRQHQCQAFSASFCLYWLWPVAVSLQQLAGFNSPSWVSRCSSVIRVIFTDKPIEQHPLGKTDEISLWIQSSLFSLLALLALFGWACRSLFLLTMV